MIEPIQEKMQNVFKENIKTYILIAAITFGVIFFLLLFVGCFILPAIHKACLCAKLAMKSLLTCDTKTYRFISFENNGIKIGEKCVLGDTNSPTPNCVFSGSYTSYLIRILIILYSIASIWACKNTLYHIFPISALIKDKFIRKTLISIREFIKGLNRRAYMYVAITGENFCSSMKGIILIFASHPMAYIQIFYILSTAIIELYNKLILIMGTI
ncbi:hypothetical protein MXB_3761, partial [Myxobolus squamalis]